MEEQCVPCVEFFWIQEIDEMLYPVTELQEMNDENEIIDSRLLELQKLGVTVNRNFGMKMKRKAPKVNYRFEQDENTKDKYLFAKDESGFNKCPSPKCDFKCKNIHKLKRHYARIHNGNIYNFQIDSLNPDGSNGSSKIRGGTAFICHMCDYECESPDLLQTHISNRHEEMFSIICQNLKFLDDFWKII